MPQSKSSKSSNKSSNKPSNKSAQSVQSKKSSTFQGLYRCLVFLLLAAAAIGFQKWRSKNSASDENQTPLESQIPPDTHEARRLEASQTPEDPRRLQAVTAQVPVDGITYAGQPLSYFLQGTGLSCCGPTDTLRFVTPDDTQCSTAAAGTSDITSFAPIHDPSFLGVSDLVFATPGDYRVCIKYAGTTAFVLLSSDTFFIRVVGPSSYSPTTMDTRQPLR